uniref:C-CAP/cofactor C-like domain-containing protein n=1 Tax=Timema poppense TaxID=170557 RepID=A0A7R9CXR9_TIMPO|nr:unnamed protein product [Timema poppensis]
MKVDTAASASLIGEPVYLAHFKHLPLVSTNSLRGCTEHELDLLGEIPVKVLYQGQSATLPLVVVWGSFPSLLSISWISHIQLDWNAIFPINYVRQVQGDVVGLLRNKYPSVFKEVLETLRQAPSVTAPANTPVRPAAAPPRLSVPRAASSNSSPGGAPLTTRSGRQEYQTGVPDLMIDNVDQSDIVYMFKCQSTNLVIKGKLNSVILDSCCNSSIVFDSISTGIEFINCQSVHMQPRTAGNLETDDPVAAINSAYHQTTGRLPLSCLGTELSHRSTNLSEEARHLAPEEYPVPEQFKTTIGIMGLSWYIDD